MEDTGVRYGAEGIRFTCRGDVLNVFLPGLPKDPITIKSPGTLYPSEIWSVRMPGIEQDLRWSLCRAGPTVPMPQRQPCEHAVVRRIRRKHPFRA